MKTLLRKLDLSYLYSILSQSTLALTFILYTVLARALGPDQYGIFSAAVAVAGILSLLIQFGLPWLLGREVAANPYEGAKSTTVFIVLEIFNSLPVLLLLFPISYGLGFRGVDITVCYLMVLAELLRTLKMTLRNVLKGMGRFREESISTFSERFFTLVLVLSVLALSKSLILTIGTLLFARSLDILGLIFYLSRRTELRSSIKLEKIFKIYRLAFPFALSGVLWIIYYQADMVMLKSMSTTAEVGFYSVSYRTLEIFLALPQAFFHVISTKLARCYAVAPDRLSEEIKKAVYLITLGGLPIILVIGFCSNFLIKVIYGETFSPATQSFCILVSGMSVTIFSMLSNKIFEASKRERELPYIGAITVVFNIAINSILIPPLGAVGAAVATLASNILLCFLSLSLLSRSSYTQIIKHTRLIALISLLISSIPPLILNGLNLALGIGLIIFGVALIAIVVHRRCFISNLEYD